ncbi:hypothetical protein [Tritonibacter scottomollicae]|uniref:hypothetical protein n=1 Tax=Tritonibacter scottomollicae TaxID=483013 RepID=UPI003AA87650
MRKLLIQTSSIAIGVLVAMAIFHVISLLAPFTLTAGQANFKSQINYSDFIAIILTAVTVVLGALGFVVAILAFVGWNSIQGRVEEQTERVIAESLEENGELKELVKASLKKGGTLYKLVQDEANRIIYSGILPVGPNDEDDDFPERYEESEVDK